MFEKISVLALSIFGAACLIGPYIAGAVYRRRAEIRADEMLAGNFAEFNKRIRANAVIVLIRRGIWGLFFLAVTILFFLAANETGFYWLPAGCLVIGIICFAFAWRGYGFEIGRLKKME